MGITLLDIKEDVNRYINIISSLMKVDVGVVDSSMTRVTGTGLYKNIAGVLALGSVYKNTLETGETHIIKNPRKHKLCSQCKDINNCRELLEISTPIYCQNEIVGVLGLVCFSTEQKEMILANLESYLSFTKQIAEFIGIKFFEHKENLMQKDRERTLKAIIDNINKGVIICDREKKIATINSIGITKFGLGNAIGKHMEIISQNDYIMNEEIFKMIIDGKEYNVTGKIIPLMSLENKTGNAFVFEDLKKISKNILEVSTDSNRITIEDIHGDSKATKNLRENILKVANSTSTVLITGESGTGKELVARSLHSHSNRKNRPFVVINCSAIPDSLLESELFGYVKGAFTGADNNGRMGKFELANTGVIFLDEIGDMPLYLQAKILRVIQEKKIERIGSNKSIDLDIRIIAATNLDLEKRIEENKFRRDLYYRLNVIPMTLVPLRERREDILPITDYFIEKFNRVSQTHISEITDEVKMAFLTYDWPGNIRELENTIELMFNISGNSDILTKNLLPDTISHGKHQESQCMQTIINDKDELLDFETIEKNYIISALERYGDSTEGKKLTADKMGIGLTTLYRKMKKYKLD